MEVLLYGRLAEAIGRRVTVDVPAEGCTIAELRQRLAEQYPLQAQELTSDRVKACVGDTIVSNDAPVDRTDRVELFPPVSGG